MNLISAKGYKNANIHCLKMRKTGELWISMKDVGDGLGVKNISDLVLKEIYGIYEKRKSTKMFKKFDNLNEEELDTKSNKNVYVKNNIMTNIIKHCKGEKKEE